MLRSVSVFVVLTGLVTPAVAGPLEARDVPAQAELVVHVDVDALRASKLHSIFKAEVDQAIAEMKEELAREGVPLDVDDLVRMNSITFWAEGGDIERGALIASGLDTKKLVAALVKLKAGKKIRYQGHTLMQIEDGGNPTFMGIQGSSIVVANDKKSVAVTVDVLAGQGSSLARTPKAARLGSGQGVLFAAVFEHGIADKIKREAGSEIFKKIGLRGGRVLAMESADALVARALIETTDATGANQLHKLAAGAISFFSVASDDADLAKLIDGLEVKSSGSTVTFELKLPFSLIKQLAPMLHQKARGHGHHGKHH